ncbi:flagellin, partial [Delftia sp. WSY_7]
DASFTFQVGANTAADNQINVVVSSATSLGSLSDSTASLGSVESAALAQVDAIDSALDNINGMRADYGAAQNRFEATIANLQVASENTAAARGRIMDADFAGETSNLSRAQILQQAGTAMVAQANQLPQGVLALLR